MKKAILGVVVCLVLFGAMISCDDECATTVDTGSGDVLTHWLPAIIAETEAQVGGMVDDMELLAMTEELKSADWERMLGLLTKLQEDNLPGTVWYVLPDGSYSTVEMGKVDANLSDRAYFPGLMSGEEQLGDIVVSKSTGNKSLIAAVPVMMDGKVVGGLGASIFLSDLGGIILSELPEQLPDDMVFYAVNEEGEIVLHSNASMVMAESTELEDNVVATGESSLLGWTFSLAYKN